MKAIRYAAHLVETLAQLLLAAGRISFDELVFISDWVDTNFGTLLHEFTLNRYAEIATTKR